MKRLGPCIRRAGLAAAAACLLALPGPLSAEPYAATEYDVKAAFLYNFAKFVEWPPAALEGHETFVIGVLGNDPFGDGLDVLLAGKTIQDKKLVVTHVQTLKEAAACQVLFVSPDEKKREQEIIAALRQTPVLTVGDTASFFQKGGIVGFEMVHKTVRFHINLPAAEEANLKISSQLLKVAKSVRGAPAAESR